MAPIGQVIDIFFYKILFIFIKKKKNSFIEASYLEVVDYKLSKLLHKPTCQFFLQFYNSFSQKEEVGDVKKT